MKYILTLLLFVGIGVYAQCVPPSSEPTGCIYSTTVNSTNGYQVVINITPSHIIAPTSCPNGYGSNAVLNYNIQFTGSNIPANLWNLQFSLGCTPHNYNGSFPTSGGIGSSTSSNSPYRNASDCSTVSFTSLGCNTLNITISGPGISNQVVNVPCQPQTAHPSPSSFGNNEWILFGYNGNNFNTYRGYYKNTALNFDTRTSWTQTVSPSSTSNYVGCSINNNQHSYQIKRKGFPCGFYQINLLGHNNRVKFNVNGTEIYANNSASSSVVNNIWSGFLDGNSTLECTIRTMNNNSFAAFDVVNTYGSSFAVWRGSENSNFNNANNWCNGSVPNSSNSVLIPSSGVVNNLSINSAITVTNIHVEENGVLNIGGTANLNVTGNIVNNGTINASAAAVTFSGSAAQVISGTSFDVRNFTLNNASGVSLDFGSGEQMMVSELLTVTTGSLHTNNQIYLPCDYFSASNICSFVTSFVSTNGYTVNLEVTPKLVITASNACAFGYNYNIEYDYNTQFTGSNIPASLFSLSASLTCDTNDSIFFSLPTSAGSGTATTTSNPYRNFSDCATATVNSIGCNALSFTIEGPGIGNQTVSLNCNFASTGGASQIAPIGGTINGSITVEQCYPALRAFRFITSSVNSTGSIRENWQENATTWSNNPKPGYGTHITGVGSNADGTNGFDLNPSGAASMFTFDNSSQTWSSIPNTNISTLTAGKPYRLLLRGSRSTNIQLNNVAASNTKIRTTGTVVKGPVQAQSLSSTSGNFNFIGNPFHAQVDMQAVLNESTNLIPFIYLWDSTMATRGAYVTIDPSSNTNNNLSSDANKYLEPFQAVFIQTGSSNQTPVLTFKESHKSTNQAQTTTFKTTNLENSFISLTLYNTTSFNENNAACDGVRVNFNPNNSNEVDALDAIKVANIDENVSFRNQGILLSYENRNIPTDSEIMPLEITNYKSNEYIFKIKAHQIMGVNSYLMDYFTNTQTQIQNTEFTTYSFTIDNQIEASKSSDRFAVIFENEVLNMENQENQNLSIFPNPVKDQLFVNLPSDNEQASISSVLITNLLGQTVFEKEYNLNENNQIHIQNLSLINGYYILTIQTNSGKKIHKKFIKE